MSYEDYLDVAFFMNMWCCLWFFCVWTRERTAKVLNLSSKMNEKKQKQKPKRMLLNNERPFINWWCTCSCVSILKAAKEDEGLLFKAPSLSSKIASELNSRMCDVENKSHSAFDDRTMISAATKASRLFWQKKKLYFTPNRTTKKRKFVSMFSRQIQHWKSSVQGSLGRFLSEQIEFQEKDTHLEKLKRMKASTIADSWNAALAAAATTSTTAVGRLWREIKCS